ALGKMAEATSYERPVPADVRLARIRFGFQADVRQDGQASAVGRLMEGAGYAGHDCLGLCLRLSHFNPKPTLDGRVHIVLRSRVALKPTRKLKLGHTRCTSCGSSRNKKSWTARY